MVIFLFFSLTFAKNYAILLSRLINVSDLGNCSPMFGWTAKQLSVFFIYCCNFCFSLDICLKICYTIDIVGKCFKLGQLASYVRLCHEAFINFLLDICKRLCYNIIKANKCDRLGKISPYGKKHLISFFFINHYNLIIGLTFTLEYAILLS